MSPVPYDILDAVKSKIADLVWRIRIIETKKLVAWIVAWILPIVSVVLALFIVYLLLPEEMIVIYILVLSFVALSLLIYDAIKDRERVYRELDELDEIIKSYHKAVRDFEKGMKELDKKKSPAERAVHLQKMFWQLTKSKIPNLRSAGFLMDFTIGMMSPEDIERFFGDYTNKDKKYKSTQHKP